MIELVLIAGMIILTSRASLINDNLTIVLQLHQYRLWAIIYMIITTVYLAYRFITLFHQSVDGKRYDRLVIITSIIMILGILCPYNENRHDLWSQIHVYASLYGCLVCLFMGLLLLKSLYLSGRSVNNLFAGIVLMSMIILASIIQCGGISGISEILTLITILAVLRIAST
ncbi:MAG: hypothetical protein J6P61_01125 [Erysipelotrichaceae bacterium]|nr:hypothetical protein [Erysipelotrichaceae bacterium]